MQLKDAQLFRQQAFIDGAWVDADNGQTIKVNNPATGEILGTVPKTVSYTHLTLPTKRIV